MRQLSGIDAAFLYLEGPGQFTHLTGVYLYDPSSAGGRKIRFKDIQRHLASRLQRSPVFRQRLLKVPLQLDYPYWVDDTDFDIEFHLRQLALPKPGDWRQLCRQVARLHAVPLDMSRPPWEMYVIEGLNRVQGLPKGCFAVITKYHHAAVDGATGIELLSALHDLAAGTADEDEPDPAAVEAQPGSASLLARAALNNLRRPIELGRAVAGTLPGLARVLLDRQRRAPREQAAVPRTRFNARVSAQRVFDGREFALSDFQDIRNAAPGTTINDVILAVVAGALREYLLAKQELPDASLAAMVPISTRTPTESGPGNRVSAMLCELHTTLDDAGERLRAISDSAREAKRTIGEIGERQLADVLQNLPSISLALAGKLANRSAIATRRSLCSCIVTNVPGPQRPLYFCGAELLSIWGCGPVMDGVGLLLLAASYNGRMCLSISCCREIMPDAGFFADCLDQAFEQLRDALTPKTV